MVSDGFTSCFILFWLTIPFLNVLIRNLDRKMHLRLIALCLFIYTAVLYIPTGGVRMNYVSWFMVLYFISSYIRLYPDHVFRSDSKFINAVGSTTFGVLLIHAHSDVMRHWLWRDTIDCVGHYSDEYYYLYAPAAVLIIFAVCSLIDYVRIQTLEKWAFQYLDKKWLKKV